MYKVRISEVIDLLPPAYRYLIVSRICYLQSRPTNNTTFMLPLRFAKYNTISGASNMVMSEEEQARI